MLGISKDDKGDHYIVPARKYNIHQIFMTPDLLALFFI